MARRTIWKPNFRSHLKTGPFGNFLTFYQLKSGLCKTKTSRMQHFYSRFNKQFVICTTFFVVGTKKLYTDIGWTTAVVNKGRHVTLKYLSSILIKINKEHRLLMLLWNKINKINEINRLWQLFWIMSLTRGCNISDFSKVARCPSFFIRWCYLL